MQTTQTSPLSVMVVGISNFPTSPRPTSKTSRIPISALENFLDVEVAEQLVAEFPKAGRHLLDPLQTF